MNPVKERLDELEKLVQDDDGKPLDIDAIDDAAIQAKVKEIEEAMHGVSAKLCKLHPLKWLSKKGLVTMVISMLVVTMLLTLTSKLWMKTESRLFLRWWWACYERSCPQDTTRSNGREALQKNIQAAMALSEAIRSTLGPKGLDKLLIDDEGQTLVTNDGVTVLETAKVEHPVAKMMINTSSTQDKLLRMVQQVL